MRQWVGRLAAGGCAAAAVVGCGGSGSVALTGIVKLDDQPVKDGVINFTPFDGNGQTAAAIIKDGAFAVTLKAGGVSKVEISASKVVGKKKMYETPDSPTYDVTEEIVPQKYNAKSELKHTATGGTQTVEFLLTTK